MFIVFPFSLTYSFSLKYSTQVFPLVSLASASKYFLPLSMPYIMCYPNIFKIPITTPCHTHPLPSPHFSAHLENSSFREPFLFTQTSLWKNWVSNTKLHYGSSIRKWNIRICIIQIKMYIIRLHIRNTYVSSKGGVL